MTREPDIVERLRQNTSADRGLYRSDVERREAADEIERLRAALQRIDGINDNPAYFRFNPMIEEVLRAALEPKP